MNMNQSTPTECKNIDSICKTDCKTDKSDQCQTPSHAMATGRDTSQKKTNGKDTFKDNRGDYNMNVVSNSKNEMSFNVNINNTDCNDKINSNDTDYNKVIKGFRGNNMEYKT